MRIIRRRWTPVLLTDADVEQLLRARSAPEATAGGAEREREIRSALQAPHADTIPAFSELIIDRTGRLWVREANPADAVSVGQTTTYPVGPSHWSVFDPRGRWLGDVTMPARFWPKEIGEDYVLGVARDELDVPTVVE